MDYMAKLRVIAILSVGSLFLVVLVFLYKNFYQTIIQANVVILLKNEVALQSIDINKFNAAYNKHQFKKTNLLPDILPDPFKTN